MTLTSELTRIQYAGDGATVSFPVTFVFWGLDDLRLTHADASGTETLWTRGTQYTVSGGNGSTGTVTVSTSPTDYTPASGETLTILSDLTDTQQTDLPEGGSFSSSSVEQQLDKIVRMLQQKAESLGRAIKFAVSSSAADITFPDPVSGGVIRYNTAADALETSTATDGGSLTLPLAVADGGTGGATAAAALDSLGIDGSSGNIATGDLAASAVTTAKINAAAVTTAKINDGAVTTAKIVDDAVVTAKITDGAVTPDKVSASIWSTGDVRLTLKTTADAGWVMMNDGTIGSATSGGTTRANADTEDLFTLLWTNIIDTWAPVSTGRGVSAAADFASNKTIALPKVLGRALSISGTGATLTARALGETLGEEDHTMTEAELFAHDHLITAASGTGGAETGVTTITDGSTTAQEDHMADTGSTTPFNVMQPSSFLNAMVKL